MGLEDEDITTSGDGATEQSFSGTEGPADGGAAGSGGHDGGADGGADSGAR